jgi:uncharacterized membrane protein
VKLQTNLRAGFGVLAAQTQQAAKGSSSAFSNEAWESWTMPSLADTLDTAGLHAMHIYDDVAEWIERKQEAGTYWLEQWLNPKVQVLDTSRFWEVDAARGLAIGMMVLVHLIETWVTVLSVPLAALVMAVWTPFKMAFILGIAAFWAGTALLSSSTFNRWIRSFAPDAPEIAAAIAAGAIALAFGGWMATAGSGSEAFLFIMGVSMAISSQRRQGKPWATARYLERGLQLFGLGMVLTLTSLLLIPQEPILFGTLHLLGMASILVVPFLGWPAWAAVGTGSVVIGAGALIVPHWFTATPMWLWLGIRPFGFRSLDYAPLLPHFGLVLLGLAAGRVLYPQGRQRSFNLPDLSETPVVRALSVLGQHALAIYMAQSPILIAGHAALVA